MKNMRKTLSVILSVVLVLANISLVAFANTTTTPEYTTSEDIVGYSAALVERVDLTNVPSITERPNDLLGEHTAWKISTAEELVAFAGYVVFDASYTTGCFAGETIYLANDIDLSSVENFIPVGGWATTGDAAWAKIQFRGTFDGQGYAIKNMKMTMPAGVTSFNGYVGFFRNLGSGAVVRNLVFDENCVVSCGDYYNVGPMGILCGAIDTNMAASTNLENDTVTISNVYVQGKLIHGGGTAGAIAPYAKAAAVTIDHCTNAATLEPSTKEITDTNGDVQTAAEKSAKWGTSRGVGGILGIVGEGTSASKDKPNKVIPVTVTITNCRNAGKIIGGKAPAGGIVGAMTTAGRPINESNGWTEVSGETKHLTVQNCINNGEIGYVHDTTSAQGLGGILGLNQGNGTQHLVTIKDCTNYATITDSPVVTPDPVPETNPGALVNQIANEDFIADANDETKNTVIPAVLTNNTSAAGQTDATLEQALWQDKVAIADPTPAPGGDTPSGDTPSGDTPSGDTPSGDTPSGDTSNDNTTTQAPETEAPTTQAPTTTEKKSGCGATVALIPVMMVTLGAAAVALKKKED